MSQLQEKLARRKRAIQNPESSSGAGAGAGQRNVCLSRRNQSDCQVDDKCKWATWSKYCYPSEIENEFGHLYNTTCGSEYCRDWFSYDQTGGCPLSKLTCKDLKAVAKNVNMKGYSKMRRNELCDSIHQATNE